MVSESDHKESPDTLGPSTSANTAKVSRKTLGIFASLRTFLLWLYFLATSVGFAYAHAYYGEFDIDFLNFATVLDFIFVSLANIGTLPTIIPFVIVVSSALALLLGLVAFVAGLIVQGFVRSSASLLYWNFLTLLARITHVVARGSLFLGSVVAFVLKTFVAPFRKTGAALLVMYRERRASQPEAQDRLQTGGAAAGEQAEENTMRREQRPNLPFGRVYASVADEYRVSFGPLESQKTEALVSLLKKKARSRPNDLAKLWSESWRWLAKKAKETHYTISRSRSWIFSLLALFFVIAIAAAAGTGVVDARCLLENEENCKFEFSDYRSYSYFIKWFPNLYDAVTSGNGDDASVTLFIVPSINLASMKSMHDEDCLCGKRDESDGGGKCPDCGEQKTRCRCPREYVSVKVRQSLVGDEVHALPSRLVYIGAVEHAQFLAEIGDKQLVGSDGGASPAPPDDPPPVPPSDNPPPAPPPDNQQAAPPTDDPPSAPPPGSPPPAPPPGDPAVPSPKRELVANVGPFRQGEVALEKGGLRCMKPQGLTDFEGVKAQVEQRIEGGGCVMDVLLIGHVDSRPINSESFRSNLGLAQARVDETYSALEGEDWAKGIDVVRLPAGPRSSGRQHDPCDRYVEVHMRFCPKPRASS